VVGGTGKRKNVENIKWQNVILVDVKYKLVATIIKGAVLIVFPSGT
jgi:hypothetical protein